MMRDPFPQCHSPLKFRLSNFFIFHWSPRQNGATTSSIATLIITTLNIMTFSIVALSITTFSKTTLSMKGLICDTQHKWRSTLVTFRINVTQHNNTLDAVPSCWVSRFYLWSCWVSRFYLLLCWMSLCWASRFIYCGAECHYAECRDLFIAMLNIILLCHYS